MWRQQDHASDGGTGKSSRRDATTTLGGGNNKSRANGGSEIIGGTFGNIERNAEGSLMFGREVREWTKHGREKRKGRQQIARKALANEWLGRGMRKTETEMEDDSKLWNGRE